MVYNIHAGKDAAGADNLERVAELIRKEGADVVLLQEVDRGTERSGRVDQLARLMSLTKFHGAFGKSLDYQGGDYGIAILSRWPVVASETIPLPVVPPQTRAGGSIEPRVALVADIAAPGGTVRIFNTHLDASREETYRLQELDHLLAAIGTKRPLLAGGDFNAEPGSRVHERAVAAGLRDAWLECGSGDGLTFPAHAPVKRIDDLFLRDGARCSEARVIATEASDHRPVVIRVTRS